MNEKLLLYWYGRLRALAGNPDLAAVRAYLHAHAQIAKLMGEKFPLSGERE